MTTGQEEIVNWRTDACCLRSSVLSRASQPECLGLGDLNRSRRWGRIDRRSISRGSTHTRKPHRDASNTHDAQGQEAAVRRPQSSCEPTGETYPRRARIEKPWPPPPTARMHGISPEGKGGSRRQVNLTPRRIARRDVSWSAAVTRQRPGGGLGGAAPGGSQPSGFPAPRLAWGIGGSGRTATGSCGLGRTPAG
jgi:hypothetical protein